MERSETFLDRTGQTLKFDMASLWLPLLGLALCFLVAPAIAGSDVARGAFLIGGFALLIAADVWGGLAIRCPTCRARLYLKGVREHGALGYGAWIKSLTECPVCGSDGGANAVAMHSWTPDPPYWTSKRIAVLAGALLLLVIVVFVSGEYAKHAVAGDGLARQPSSESR